MPALGRGEKIPPRDGEAWLTRLRLRLCSALSVIRRRNLCCNRSRRHHLPAKRETHYVGADSFGEIVRSEEHTSELQSLMRISYAVFCLKKKKNNRHITNNIRQ